MWLRFNKKLKVNLDVFDWNTEETRECSFCGTTEKDTAFIQEYGRTKQACEDCLLKRLLKEDKAFKAKSMLEKGQYILEDEKCDCCKQMKKICLMIDPEEFGPAICLDCLQYEGDE